MQLHERIQIASEKGRNVPQLRWPGTSVCKICWLFLVQCKTELHWQIQKCPPVSFSQSHCLQEMRDVNDGTMTTAILIDTWQTSYCFWAPLFPVYIQRRNVLVSCSEIAFQRRWCYCLNALFAACLHLLRQYDLRKAFAASRKKHYALFSHVSRTNFTGFVFRSANGPRGGGQRSAGA